MKQIKVTVNESVNPRSVTLELIDRPYYGKKKSRRFTVSERNFLKALEDAHIIAPWERVF